MRNVNAAVPIDDSMTVEGSRPRHPGLPAVLSYCLSAALVVAAYLARVLFTQHFGGDVTFLLFIPAILLSSGVGVNFVFLCNSPRVSNSIWNPPSKAVGFARLKADIHCRNRQRSC